MSGYARIRPRSLRKALILPVLMILSGMLLLSPTASFGAKTDSGKVVYLYPTKANNPVQENGLFWLESAPQVGSLPLDDWEKIIPNKAFAIGVPDSHVVSGGILGSTFRVIRKSFDTPRRPGGVGDNVTKYLTTKVTQDKKPPGGGTKTKDILLYKRTIGPEGITEELKVEVGEHFSDNDAFDRYVDKVKDKLITNPEEIGEAVKNFPQEVSGDSKAEIVLGGGLVLSGLLSALKVFWPLIFAL